MDNEIKIENLAGMILDKHFPHSYYSPVVSWELGTFEERKIHDNECERCKYNDQIIPAIIEALKTNQTKQL